jgi:glycosyltransferase involved in cell wall biosynthesis
MKVIVIIPAFNEGKTIGRVIQDLKHVVNEVIVVDDASTDDTRTVAQQAGAIVLHHERNAGYDISLNDGFQLATQRGADILMTFDADGEHDAQDVPAILKPIEDGTADMVIGQRPSLTHFSEKLFAQYTWRRFGIKDPLCGFKAYHRRVYDAVGFFDSFHSIGTELMIRGIRQGFRATYVPIRIHQRVHDSSRFYKKRFRANLKVLGAWWRGMVQI